MRSAVGSSPTADRDQVALSSMMKNGPIGVFIHGPSQCTILSTGAHTWTLKEAHLIAAHCVENFRSELPRLSQVAKPWISVVKVGRLSRSRTSLSSRFRQQVEPY